MNAKKIGYWATTGLAAFALASGGLMNASRGPEVVQSMAHLGYPAYMSVIIGVWKTLAAVALLLPKTPRLKEWAYAGVFFNMTGAAISHAASGDDVGKVVTPLIVLGIAIASWALRPEDRRLAGPIV